MLVSNVRNTEEALAEANPKSEKDRPYWEARVKDSERQLKKLKEILRRGKVRYLKGIPEQERDISRKKQVSNQWKGNTTKDKLRNQTQQKDSELTDEIQITKEWLWQLKMDKTAISKALLFMSSEVNLDGRIITGNNNIQKELIAMRKTFTNPNIAITFTNFEKLDKSQIKQFMMNSKHSRKYSLSQNKIESIVLFHLHIIFKETEDENIDGVFLGFDSKKKIVSWFD